VANLIVKTTLHGIEEAKRELSHIPVSVRRGAYLWLLKEKGEFIGTDVKPGLIKRYLLAKQKWRDKKPWDKRVINLFKGSITDPVNNRTVTRSSISTGGGAGVAFTGISMALKMGILYKTQKDIHKILELFETGGTYSSSKYMPILYGAHPNIKKPYLTFQHFMSTRQFFAVYKNGLAYYFLKGSPKGTAPLYIGTKKITVRWHIDLVNKFEQQESAMLARGDAAIEKAVKDNV
jgi:hypothetical protein